MKRKKYKIKIKVKSRKRLNEFFKYFSCTIRDCILLTIAFTLCKLLILWGLIILFNKLELPYPLFLQIPSEKNHLHISIEYK